MLGAAIIRYDKVSDHFWTGLLLVQLSNLCFAIGMVGYKRLMEVRPMPQHNAFTLVLCRGLYRGGGGVVYARQRQKLPTTTLQWSVLVWLGVVASGLGYFMWNYGATGGCRHAGDHE